MIENIKKWKEFALSSAAVNNRKTVYLLIIILLLGGVSAYKNMPRESFPQIQVPGYNTTAGLDQDPSSFFVENHRSSPPKTLKQLKSKIFFLF